MNANHGIYVEPWIQAMRHGLLMGGRPYSENTICAHSYNLRWFLARFETVSLVNFKQAMLLIPIENFAKRRATYEAIMCFAKFLAQEGALEADLPDEIKRYRPRRHLPPKKTTVDQAGIDRLLAASQSVLDRLLVILLSQTGLRASEAAELKLEDLHLNEHYLIVKRAKWGKSRWVGLTQAAIDAIRTYLSNRGVPDSLYLMSKLNGLPMDRCGIFSRIHKLGRKTGIPVSPHALRRAFVTINANKGRPLPMLQIACGHSSIMTTRSYCMTTEDETIEAMKGWD